MAIILTKKKKILQIATTYNRYDNNYSYKPIFLIYCKLYFSIYTYRVVIKLRNIRIYVYQRKICKNSNVNIFKNSMINIFFVFTI